MADINTTLNDVFKSTPIGDVRSAIGTVLYGTNHRQTPNRVPINQDGYGLTFMTRPQLNLSTGNLRAMRQFIPLLTTDELSIPRYIRGTLDPRLNLPCPILDQKSAFIPVLTNHMLQCSGWPDPLLEVHTSHPGNYKEVFAMVDSTINIYSAYDISATFRNMIGDPITSLFYVWAIYMSSVFTGDMTPYPDMIANNEIDYNTRIYRLILDKTKRYVQKIACTGASFPRGVPIGRAFDFDHIVPLNPAQHDPIQIQIQCIGVRYQDPIIVYNFNKVVEIFNPSMNDSNRSSAMQQLKQSELQFFNNRGYPRIDPNTMELLWFVSQQDYTSSMAGYTRNMNALKSTVIQQPDDELID